MSNKRLPEFLVTESNKPTILNTENSVVAFVQKEKSRYERARREVEVMWLEAWALYLGSPRAVSYQRQQVINSVGDVNADWRHRINVGKAYEAVETIHGYLMSATFPNRDFFDMQPTKPGYADLAKVVKKYMANKMYESKFVLHYEDFLRQLIITGNSVIAIPWRYETIPYKKNIKVKRPSMLDVNGMPIGESWQWEVIEEQRVSLNRPDFEVLDVFNCYLEPSSNNPNTGGFIRRIIKTRAEVIGLIRAGYYTAASNYDIGTVSGMDAYSQSRNNLRTISSFTGVNTSADDEDDIELTEYWGDIVLDDGTTYHDVTATICGDSLLHFEPNPYWGGKPFVWGTYTSIRQAYAMGAITPNAGLLHELNIITNQRLDNQELSIDSMFTVKQDGIIQPEDVRSEPGKVYSVLDHTDIQPLPPGNLNWKVTYQEVEVLERIIDKNFSTGSMISAGAGRSGERVTATEIQAVRDAGGNRLSNLHRHIEESALYPILIGVFNMMRQFVKEPEVIRVTGEEPGEYNYYELDPEVAFQYDYKLMAIGADYVTDQSKYIQERLQFIQAVSQIPDMAKSLNWSKLLYDIVHHMGFEDPDAYIIEDAQNDLSQGNAGAVPNGDRGTGSSQPEQAQPGSTEGLPTSPEQLALSANSAVQNKLSEIGGKPLNSAYEQMLASGQLPQEMQALGSPSGIPTETQLPR